MMIQKCVTVPSPNPIVFKKVEHKQELFKKFQKPELKTERDKKWNNL